MPGLTNAKRFSGPRLMRGIIVVMTVLCLGCLASAQIRGIPPLATSIPNHTYPYLPNTPPLATSLGPYGYAGSRPSNIPYGPHGAPRRGRGIGGYGSGYAVGAAVPYYYLYPSDDSGYDTGVGSGPYMYSGPPDGGTAPAEQTLHIVVEQAPARQPAPQQQADATPPMMGEPALLPEPQPGVPTLLVFRDGRQQEVNNYAIMGQTVYVFDKRSQKIALADLDVAATIKANEDEGVEFKIPAEKKSSKPATPVPHPAAPAPKTTVPAPPSTNLPNPNTLTSSLLP